MGDLVDGRFTLETLLGSGTFGEAHRARDRDGKVVVVKLVHAHLQAIDGVAERFRREVLALERLRHPHVVTLVASGSCPKRGLYYVMDWSPGEPLDRIVARGPLPAERARALVAQLASALVAAHALGIVHRDLKPGNLLVEDAGSPGERVRVLDFGLAKHLQGGERTRKELTQGAALGTPHYMSPEQYEGTATLPASDLYAVGCVLMELLTGKPPFFDARTIGGLMAKHLREIAPSLDSRLPGAPADLVALVARCLAKDAASRPTAAEAREILAGSAVAPTHVVAMVRARLELGGRRIFVFGGADLRFGRNGSGENDLVLRAFARAGEAREAVEKRSLEVSGRHGRFSLSGALVTVTDLGSTRGTKLDGKGLAAHAPTPVGDVFRLEVAGVLTLAGRVLRRGGEAVALSLSREGEAVSYLLAPGEVSIGPGAMIEGPTAGSVDLRGGRVRAVGVEVHVVDDADMKAPG